MQAVRSMRAVLWRTLQHKIILLASARSGNFDHGPPKAASNAVEAAARVLDGPEGRNMGLGPSNRLIYTYVSGTPYLS